MLKIKATGKVAWAVAIGAIGVVEIIALGSGGAAAPAGALIGGGSVSVLGLFTAISAVAIAFAADGISALNSLRRYKIVANTDSKLILSRK